MIITLINFISEKIDNFKRRNRSRPSFYRLFLLWLTLIILITVIFYIIDNLNTNKLRIVKIDSPLNDLVEEKINLPNIVYNKKVSYSPEKTDLYNDILNKVGQIPKPLSFVDDFNYNL